MLLASPDRERCSMSLTNANDVHDSGHAALARRFFDALAAGDMDAVRSCYAPEAIVWRNTDRSVRAAEAHVRELGAFAERVTDRRYDDRRVRVFDGGFVHQHVLRCTRADGVAVKVPGCVVCDVVDGRITRLDEYLDSADAARLVTRTSTES